jgi:tRNA(Ile)-lysidine synthase
LLGIPRARLTATLVARGVAWTEDPSNTDPRFERARLRATGVPLPSPSGADGLAEGRSAREGHLAESAVEALEFDQGEVIAFDPSVFVGLGNDEGARLLGRVVQALARRDYPPRRERLDRAAARVSRASSRRGKSGKGQDFTLSECHLALRQGRDRRLRWIVRAESGRRDLGNAGQPLIPAVFFACGAHGAPHLG